MFPARHLTRAALLAAMLSAAPAQALDLGFDETKPALRMTVAEDLVHAKGSVVVAARYGGAWGVRAGFWARTEGFEGDAPRWHAGVNYMWTVGRVRAELGAVWIDKINDLNGTHLDFDAALAFDVSQRVFVEYRHYSHGKKAGIAKNASNDGWNLFGVGYTF